MRKEPTKAELYQFYRKLYRMSEYEQRKILDKSLDKMAELLKKPTIKH